MALLQRIIKSFAKPGTDSGVAELYRQTVTQIRRPEFYQTLGIPDNIDGRFDLLVLHIFLLMRRLDDREVGNQAEAKQQLFDLMFADMDRSLREMGVGDMGVGKRIRPMISAFYGRSQAYEKALSEKGETLAAALGRNLYGASGSAPDILHRITDYVRRCADMLDRQSLESLLLGQVEFANPVA